MLVGNGDTVCGFLFIRSGEWSFYFYLRSATPQVGRLTDFHMHWLKS